MRVAAGILFGIALCGCRPVGETQTRHAVHNGENAVLSHAGWDSVPVAISKETVHEIDRAAEARDTQSLEALSARGKILQVASRTKVVVLSESFNERLIRIQDGPHTGKTGWVPFEWLSPPVRER